MTGATDRAVDTHLPGDPASVERLADWLAGATLPVLEEVASVTARARVGVAGEWRGATADRVAGVLDALARWADRAHESTAAHVRELRDYAGRLASVQRRLAALRDEARAEGLLVSGTVVSVGPAGDERLDCVMAGMVDRAQELFDEAFRAATDLGSSGRGLEVFGAMLHGADAAVAVRQGQWTGRANALTKIATAEGTSPHRAGDLLRRADDLTDRGRALGRSSNAVLLPLSVWADHESGEPWEQATASAGSGALAAGATGALTGWAATGLGATGPLSVAAAGVGFVAGAVAGGHVNGWVDELYERRRAREAALAGTCRPPGGAGGRSEGPGGGRNRPMYVKTTVID